MNDKTIEQRVPDYRAQETRNATANLIPTEPQPPAPDFLRKTEACAYLGGISVPTLDKLVRAGKINVYRPSSDRVVFYREELKQYLLSQKDCS